MPDKRAHRKLDHYPPIVAHPRATMLRRIDLAGAFSGVKSVVSSAGEGYDAESGSNQFNEEEACACPYVEGLC
jgi:hypothetical protein